MPMTSGSSAFRTATPFASSASTRSPFSRAIASREPNAEIWSSRILVTTTTWGRISRAEFFTMSFSAYLPTDTSNTANGSLRRVVHIACALSIGRFAPRRTLGERRTPTAPSISRRVVLLPQLPVTAMNVVPCRALRQYGAIRGQRTMPMRYDTSCQRSVAA